MAPSVHTWQRLLDMAPDSFVFALARKLAFESKFKMPDEVDATGLRQHLMEDVIAHWFNTGGNTQDAYDVMKTKVRQTLEHRARWLSQYPGATMHAAEVMITLSSDILHQSRWDFWANYFHDGEAHIVFMQVWLKDDSPQSKPLLVFDCNTNSMTGVFRINSKRKAGGLMILDELPSDGFMKKYSQGIEVEKFKTDVRFIISFAERTRLVESSGCDFGTGLY